MGSGGGSPSGRPLSGKTIVLGVTGSIAAFKAPHIVTRLVSMGANVVVVMTENATKFITPLTFETLSGTEVIVDMFPEKKSGVASVEDALAGDDHLGHVHLAEAAVVHLNYAEHTDRKHKQRRSKLEERYPGLVSEQFLNLFWHSSSPVAAGLVSIHLAP